MYAHSVWLCNDYPVYKPYYDISLEGASREDIPVYGLRTVRMQLTEDPRTEVYVQFVAADVTEPIISYMTLRSNGVHVDLSQPNHAMLPCGANVPLEQHSTYLYCKIYRRIPAKEVADTNNMLTCSGHAGTPLQVCPTYSRSTLRRTTGGNTDYWEFYHQSNTLQGGYTDARHEHCSYLQPRLFQKCTHQTWSTPRGRPRLHTPTVQRYRIYKSRMVYDIRTHPRRFQQSYRKELPGQATQTSLSGQYMVMQRHYHPFQRQRPQSLQMKK